MFKVSEDYQNYFFLLSAQIMRVREFMRCFIIIISISSFEPIDSTLQKVMS